MPFANSFWSADYASGIERLTTQLQLLLGQLHELRSFVFSYMKCFHSTGEGLSQLWATGYPHDSSFRVSRGQRGGRKGSRRVVSHTRSVSHGSGPGSDSSSGLGSPTGKSNKASGDQVLLYDVQGVTSDLDSVFRQCVNDSNLHLRHYQHLASAIDGSVLAPVTAFIKSREPVVKSAIQALHEAYLNYGTAYKHLDAVRQQYTTISRLGDFPVEKSTPEPETPHEAPRSPDISGLHFPLAIPGAMIFETREDLAVFLLNIILSVPITKRKIPIPGYSNDIFSAEQLCDLFMRKRPKGFNPTRLNTEKLGQALLDWKLIIGTGFFVKKFTLGNMWFQWSDLAVQLSLNSEAPEKREDPKKYLDETFNHLTLSTSKTFNGVLKSINFGKHQYSEEELLDLEDKYNECYEEFYTQKHLLETEILRAARSLEVFEVTKIELIYGTLEKLQILLQGHFEKASETATANLAHFRKMNTSESHVAEFEKSTDHFSLGIYFPSLLVPQTDPTYSASRPSAANVNIQNIKLNFNLFKDVPLQLQSDDPALEKRSTPLFLLEMMKLLDSHSLEEVAREWTQPINFEMYWLAKNDVVTLIRDFELETAVNVQNELAIEARIIMDCIHYLSKLDLRRQVNFLKNWLLEISDSVIPSTVYDSLISAYKLNNEMKTADSERILGTIPRGNLSSLVLLLEHISRVFKLESDDRELITETAVKLNLMEVVAAIPFLHMLMRPLVVKHTNGFKPPVEEYNMLLSNLLQASCRKALRLTLLANEEHYMQRQEQQKAALELQKKNLASQREKDAKNSISSSRSHPHLAITTAEDDKSEASRPADNDGLKPDNFSLRPFRTGTTPRPSPTTSPVNRARLRSVEFMSLPKAVITPLDLNLENS